MVAHKHKKMSEEEYLFWSEIWNFFCKLDFKIIPPETEELINFKKNTKYLSLEKLPGRLIYKIDNFQSGVDTVFELKKFLQNKFTKTIKESYFNWNYLGQNEEREFYLNYLKDVFWENQYNENLQRMPNYKKILEKPWRIINYATDLDFEVKSQFEFFDEKTEDFMQNLQQVMKNWELNPFLINNDRGSFQWDIKIQNSYGFEGCIFSENKKLFQEIELKTFK
jgi:hypothetical protein